MGTSILVTHACIDSSPCLILYCTSPCIAIYLAESVCLHTFFFFFKISSEKKCLYKTAVYTFQNVTMRFNFRSKFSVSQGTIFVYTSRNLCIHFFNSMDNYLKDKTKDWHGIEFLFKIHSLIDYIIIMLFSLLAFIRSYVQIPYILKA